MVERLRAVSGAVGAVLVIGAIAVAAGSASCAATPTPVPVRTFERAQKVAFACLMVNDASGDGTQVDPIVPEPEFACAPAAPNTVSANLGNHYFALVTQATTGELAVVDLTAGVIVDEDQSTPGINFIPVGADPTDVVVAPVPPSAVANAGAGVGGTAANSPLAMAFVASGDPNNYALYAIETKRLLGDQRAPKFPLRITDLAACALPQKPVALTIVSAAASAPNGSSGASGGASGDAASCQAGYAIAALVQAAGTAPAQVLMIDPTPFVCQTATPGALPPCQTVGGAGATGALSASLAGASLSPGATWPDGVPYAVVGDLSATEPSPGPSCTWPLSQSSGGDAATNAETSAGSDANAADANGVSDGGAPDGVAPSGEEDDASPEAALAAESDAALDAPATAVNGAADATAALGVVSVAGAQPVAMVLRDDVPVLYVADSNVPLIHVIDVSNPASPAEVSSFFASSQAQPTRRVGVVGLALSPATSQFDPVSGLAIRYLYAIDSGDGSLMVFDATRPIPPPFTPPLERPHAELNPFASRDRITLGSPVATITAVRHDWPVVPPPLTGPTAYSGLICNPNPNARPIGTTDPVRLGALYAADQATVIEPQGSADTFPQRLRGVFLLATLANGNITTIDIDDWDAPCRRPDPMTPTTRTGVLDIPEPAPTSNADLSPYDTPFAAEVEAGVQASTQEAFFPVSAPNRTRSTYLLRDDTTSGRHLPYVLSTPQLYSRTGTPLAGLSQPQIVSTALSPGFVDPTYYVTPTDTNDQYGSSSPLGSAATQTNAVALPESGADGGAASTDASVSGGSSPLVPSVSTPPSVRVSFDDPTAQIDQDWTVTYEGALPAVSAIEANIGTSDGYQTLTLTVGNPDVDGGPSASNARFCSMGIEDWDIGKQRAAQVLAEMGRDGLPSEPPQPVSGLAGWTADYIEILDDLLPETDPYWTFGATPTDAGPGFSCWQGLTAGPITADGGMTDLGDPKNADARYNFCSQQFGEYGSNADTQVLRDFPILQAYDGELVIGRYGYVGALETTNRVVVGPDPSNAQTFLQPAACCFHNQIQFRVRAGGEWVTVGQTGLGLLHHVVADPTSARCVLSCAPHDALLNSRTFDVPFFDPLNGCAPSPVPLIERNSPLAMRNPMFSFVVWSGCGNGTASADAGLGSAGQHTTATRDLSFHFSMRGGFTPETISLGGLANVSIVPQSSAFAGAFGQLAVIDGFSEGLILIDLNTLGFAHTPYF